MSSDDSTSQSIDSVLQKYRDDLEKSRAKPPVQTISIPNTSSASDMDEDAQSPDKEALIDLTAEASKDSNSSGVSAEIVKLSIADDKEPLPSNTESKSGGSKTSLDSY